MVNLNHEILINEVYASPRGLVFCCNYGSYKQEEVLCETKQPTGDLSRG